MPSISDTATEMVNWVFPEHAGAPGQIHGGRMMQFYAISTSEVVTFKAALNHVGTSPLEVGVKVLAEAPRTGQERHACTAYLTFVHLGPDMRPRPCRPFTPETAAERRRWHEALERRERRLERVKRFKRSEPR